MKLFLTSSVHAVAHDIVKHLDLSKGRALVFIDTAAEPEKGDKAWLKNDRRSLVRAGFSVSDYSITGKSRKQLEVDLEKFDYLYLSGGNTSHILRQSQKSGFISLVKKLVREKGRVYIGTSAGSIIAGPKLPDYLQDGRMKLKNKRGYGFVNFTILPHWGSEGFKNQYLGKRLKAAYRKDQIPLLLLTDNEYVYVRGNEMSIIQI